MSGYSKAVEKSGDLLWVTEQQSWDSAWGCSWSLCACLKLHCFLCGSNSAFGHVDDVWGTLTRIPKTKLDHIGFN